VFFIGREVRIEPPPLRQPRPSVAPGGPERRRALQLLASSRHGGSEELLGLGHGFSGRRLAGLGRCGLASAQAAGGGGL
jgi:hypothetical protein